MAASFRFESSEVLHGCFILTCAIVWTGIWFFNNLWLRMYESGSQSPKKLISAFKQLCSQGLKLLQFSWFPLRSSTRQPSNLLKLSVAPNGLLSRYGKNWLLATNQCKSSTLADLSIVSTGQVWIYPTWSLVCWQLVYITYQ